MKRIDQPTQPPTPAHDPSRTAARYNIASAVTADANRHANERNLTPTELRDLQYLENVMREARDTLAAVGRLDLIGATA